MAQGRADHPELCETKTCTALVRASRIFCVTRLIRFPAMNRLSELTPQSCTAHECHRATVCLWSESLEEKLDFTLWLNVWKKKMTFVSADYGCGCCVHLFDLEGPKEAIDAIPAQLLTVSGWTKRGGHHDRDEPHG